VTVPALVFFGVLLVGLVVFAIRVLRAIRQERSGEPPWWREFEREFWAEVTRRRPRGPGPARRDRDEHRHKPPSGA
jgi:hypothetical protein